MLQQHISEHKRPTPVSTTRIRPQRIAARRQRELMVIIAADEKTMNPLTVWMKTMWILKDCCRKTWKRIPFYRKSQISEQSGVADTMNWIA